MAFSKNILITPFALCALVAVSGDAFCTQRRRCTAINRADCFRTYLTYLHCTINRLASLTLELRVTRC